MTKHIDVKFHKIKELIIIEDVVLKKVYTSENVVDILTKLVNYRCLNLVIALKD